MPRFTVAAAVIVLTYVGLEMHALQVNTSTSSSNNVGGLYV